MRTLAQSTMARTACALLLGGIALFLATGRPLGQAPVFGEWTELGPVSFHGIKPPVGDPVAYELMSGQPSSIAVDLTNDASGNTVYVATAGGGVWRSTNGLAGSPQFTLISDPTLPSSSGAVALDSRTNPPTIYVGTGDPDNPSNVNSYTGNGILVSRNGGATWTAIESADGGAHPFKGMGVSRIVINPASPDVVLAATGVGSDGNFAHSAYPQGNTGLNHLGIYRSADAGATWTQVKGTAIPGTNINAYFHIDLVHEPVRNVFMAGISNQGLWVSTNGEVWRTFDEAGLPTTGLPLPAEMHRISLATRGGTVWAFVLAVPYPHYTGSDCATNAACTVARAHKLFELASDADSWREIPKPTGLWHKGFLGYVAAPPGSDGLVVGAEHLFRTDDITVADPQWLHIEFGATASLHGDQHAIGFIDADRWYVGDDGGMFATLNRGTDWRSLNATLRTTEHYSASPDSADSGSYVGGQQDNGQGYTTDGSNWFQFLLGDGMYTHADPRNSTGFFASTQFGGIWYLPAAAPASLQRVLDFAADPADVNVSGGRGAFLTPYEVLPNDPRLYQGFTAPPGFDFNQARLLLTGNTDPWLAAFIPGNETRVAVQLTNQIGQLFIQYLAPDPRDATAAYVVTGHDSQGNYQSSLYRLSNISFAGGASVATVPKPERLLENADTDVLGHAAASPVCSEGLYVAKVGFVEGRKIFKTTTGGAGWTNISGNLPNVPVHWITIDPVNPDVIYVGTNVGAFVATDGGVSGEQWQRLGVGLPNVPVMQLKVSPTRKLVAATYGRGVWTMELPALSPWVPRPPVVADVSVSQSLLWPPDHRVVDVTVDYAATDDCAIPVCAVSVVSSEPSDGLGDGDTPVDFDVLDNHRVRLRAERSGGGPGRTYTISITCTGTDGLATTASTNVSVPHDRR